jgi:hypothetical protein
MADDALADLMFADFTQSGVAEQPAGNAEASPTAQATEAVSTPAETLSEQPLTTDSSATNQPAHEPSSSVKPDVEEKTADQPQSGDGAESIGLRNLREHAKGLETQVKEYGTLVDDFGGKDILLSLKPVAEVFYNPASTVDQRIAALEQVAPGALEEMLWSVAARPTSRDVLAANLFGASYDQVANAVRDGRPGNAGNSATGNKATDSSQPAIPESDEWGNPIELPEAVRSRVSQIADANRHLQSRLDALESAHSRVTQEAQARAEEQWQHEVRQRESAFLSDLISPAIDVGKQLFAASDKDTPEVRQLKEEAYNTFIQSVPEMVEQVPALKSRAQNALGLLGKRGAEVQAERLKPALKANVGQMAAKRAEFLNRLVNAEIELRALKLQQSQDLKSRRPAAPELRPPPQAAGRTPSTQRTRSTSTTCCARWMIGRRAAGSEDSGDENSNLLTF